MTQTIAIVEDDPEQRGHYAGALREQGYQVEEFSDRGSAEVAFGRRLPDLAILDIMLGAETGAGFEICRFLQSRNPRLPVIFLTSRGNEIDKIYGLQLGAWDYQTKPITFEYLNERIRSLLRIADNATQVGQASDVIRRGELELDPAIMRARWGSQPIELTPTEFDLLSVLAGRDDAVSYDELAAATRQGVVENNTINTHVVHLRKKFKQVDAEFACIKTRYGYGYHWVCP